MDMRPALLHAVPDGSGAAPILSVRQLSRLYGGVAAVAGVDLDVGRGDLLGIIGPNGAGKTTLFNLMTGFERPSSGSVTLDGRRIDGQPPHRIAARGLSRTFQNLCSRRASACSITSRPGRSARWAFHLGALSCPGRAASGVLRSARAPGVRSNASASPISPTQRGLAFLRQAETSGNRARARHRAARTHPRRAGGRDERQ